MFSGQYDFPAVIHGRPRVLDIGANCGAFSIWARQRWPECDVIAYEPQPSIFAFLQENTKHDPKIVREMAAVGDPTGFCKLRPGLDTRLCSSLYDIGRQGNASINVRVIDPMLLPPADIIKVDTEGAEGYIVEHLPHIPTLLVVEFHSERLRQRCEAALADKMTLLSCQVLQPGWGHAKWVKKEVK